MTCSALGIARYSDNQNAEPNGGSRSLPAATFGDRFG
jgi:hypothetical protein